MHSLVDLPVGVADPRCLARTAAIDKVMCKELADCLKFEIHNVTGGKTKMNSSDIWCCVGEKCCFEIRLLNKANVTKVMLDPGKVAWKKYPPGGSKVFIKSYPPTQHPLPPRKGKAIYAAEFTPDAPGVVTACVVPQFLPLLNFASARVSRLVFSSHRTPKSSTSRRPLLPRQTQSTTPLRVGIFDVSLTPNDGCLFTQIHVHHNRPWHVDTQV